MSEIVTHASMNRDAFLSAINELVLAQGWDAVSEQCEDILNNGNNGSECSISAEACYILAISRFLADDLVEAVKYGESALNADANVSEYADFLAVLHVLTGDLTKSVFYAKLASSVPSVPEIKALLPKSVPSLSNAFVRIEEEPLLRRAVSAVSSRDWEIAAHWFSQDIQFNPGNKKSFLGLANCLTVLGRYQEAVDVLRGAMHRLGDDPEVASCLGSLLALTGEFSQSKAVHRWAMELDTENPVVHASALTDLAIADDLDERYLVERCLEWGEKFGVEDEGLGESQATKKEILTVGYMLGSVSRREEARALANILSHRDETRFRTVGFGYGTLSDADNVHFQKAFDVWHDVREMDPVTLGAIAFAEGIDIFVDVAGFRDPELLTAFGARMAPLQVSWMGAPFGTGLSNMDVRLSSKGLEGNAQGKEKAVFLEAGSQLIDRPDPLEKASFERNDEGLTFGANAELCELTPQTIEWWAEILRKYPDAMLLLKDHDFENTSNLKKITNLFGNFGIAHRVDIIKSLSDAEFFSQIDVFLAPKSGHPNTSALMSAVAGVPVVCCRGGHAMSRTVADQMDHFGIGGETIANNRAEYVAIATKWSDSKEARQTFREMVSKKMVDAPLFDFKKRCHDLEKVLQKLWDEACG